MRKTIGKTCSNGASKVGPIAKALCTEAGDLSLMPRTHIEMEVEN